MPRHVSSTFLQPRNVQRQGGDLKRRQAGRRLTQQKQPKHRPRFGYIDGLKRTGSVLGTPNQEHPDHKDPECVCTSNTAVIVPRRARGAPASPQMLLDAKTRTHEAHEVPFPATSEATMKQHVRMHPACSCNNSSTVHYVLLNKAVGCSALSFVWLQQVPAYL